MDTFGYVRIGLAVPQLSLAQVDRNIAEHQQLIQQGAQQGVQILTFPELSLTGYSCGDLFHQTTLITAAQKALVAVEKISQQYPHILLAVGVPFAHQGALYNCAAIYNQGKLLALLPKSYLPNYDEFKEKIYFTPAPAKTTSIYVDSVGYEVLFGKHIIFQADQQIMMGYEICEDLWAVEPPSNHLALAGATILLNMSATNELVGKHEYRQKLVQQQSERCIAVYAYVSSGIGETTTDIAFGGHTMIYESGNLLGELPPFQQVSKLLIKDVDTALLFSDRIRNTVWADSVAAAHLPTYSYIPVSLQALDVQQHLLRNISSTPFIPATAPFERYESILQIQTNALAMRLLRAHAVKMIVGVSGGLDSTYSLLVCLRTAELLGWKTNSIIPITMPGYGTSDATKSSAVQLCEAVGLQSLTIPINEIVDRHLLALHHSGEKNTTYENAQARERYQLLFDYANEKNGLVIGTGDLSELALGWLTYSGDQMSSYAINSSIPKTLIQQLVAWQSTITKNTQLQQILQNILQIPISPELLPPDNSGAIEQKTEDIIGPYELHDFFLFHMIRSRFSPHKILFLAQHAFPDYSVATIKKWLKVFITRFFANQFKRSASPDGIKIGSVSLSPRNQWRMPSDVDPEQWLTDLE